MKKQNEDIWILSNEDLKNCHSGTKISWLRKHISKTMKFYNQSNSSFMYQTSEGEYKFIDVLTEDELKLKKELSHQYYKNSIWGVIGQYERDLLSNVESKIGRELNKDERYILIGSLNRKLRRDDILA